MKKLLVLILLFSFEALGNWGDIDGYYEGDPNQNVILESGEDYIVIRNLTAKSKLISKATSGIKEFYVAAEVFEMEAKSFCKKNEKLTQTSEVNPITFDEHTVMFSCSGSFYQYFDRKFNNVSAKIEDAKKLYELCYIFKETNDPSFKGWNCKKRIKIVEKFWPEARQILKQIENQNDKYQDRRNQRQTNLTFEIKKRIEPIINKEKEDKKTENQLASLLQKQKTCETLGFEIGKESNGECVLKLMQMEIDLNKIEEEKTVYVQSGDSNKTAEALAKQALRQQEINSSLMLMQQGYNLMKPKPRINCNTTLAGWTCF